MSELTLNMGGRVESNFTGAVTHLITPVVGSMKHRAAVKQRKVILSPDWLYECDRAGVLVPHREYLLPLFAGLRFCVTGMNQQERTEADQVIRKAGGQFSRELMSDCTHLICGTDATSSNPKVSYAQKSGMHIVTTAWLEESISHQELQPEQTFDFIQAPQSNIKSAPQAEAGVAVRSLGDVPNKASGNNETSKDHVASKSKLAAPAANEACDEPELIDDALIFDARTFQLANVDGNVTAPHFTCS